MNKCWILAWFCLLSSHFCAQSIPQLGSNNRIEFASWNLEWFGKTKKGFGPDNDSLQQALALKTIDKTDIDLWALEEIADSFALKSILKKIPKYEAVISDFQAEQKTALLFKKNEFKYISHRLLGTENKDSFSTGRFPLEVKLFSYQIQDTLWAIVVHLKSNFGNDSLKQIAYNSRKRSSEWLSKYTTEELKNRKFAILGDWNDDVDYSIYNQLPSPFTHLIYNSSGHKFSTQALSLAGKSSTVSYPDFIDHQYYSKTLVDLWIKDSCFVIQADEWVTDYAKVLSDHYPVVTFLKPKSVSVEPLLWEQIGVFPNPCHAYLSFNNSLVCELEIYNSAGQRVLSKQLLVDEKVYTKNLPNGCYTVHLNFENSVKILKLNVEN